LRITLGRQRAKAKNQLQAVLHQEGFLKPVADVFGKKGRAWLAGLGLSPAGRRFQGNPVSSLILCPKETSLQGHPQMERPGFEPPLCAMSTNRSLYAICSQMPLDKHALLHRRMTTLLRSE
jgi:hypothetical protein